MKYHPTPEMNKLHPNIPSRNPMTHLPNSLSPAASNHHNNKNPTTERKIKLISGSNQQNSCSQFSHLAVNDGSQVEMLLAATRRRR